MSLEPDLSIYLEPRAAAPRRSPRGRTCLKLAKLLGAGLALSTLASLVPGSDGALSSACKPAPAPDYAEEGYPANGSSPLASRNAHDVVFFGEVLVPTRPCSLGFCAGLRVESVLKGEPERNVLIAVDRAADDRCGPDLFQHKGVRWVVFADAGTSKTGIKYLHASADGPSFPSLAAPDFERLEATFRVARAQLDGAIAARLGRPVSAR